MRTLAIGDIHGCLLPLEHLIDAVQPDPEDSIILLGDYVDRGPDTRGVVDWILQHRDRYQLVPLRGNHEVLLMEALEDEFSFQRWTMFGGQETLASYGVAPGSFWPDAIPAEHWAFFRETRSFHETSHHIFVHGSLAPDLPPSEQPEDILLWDRCNTLAPHQSGRPVICGHTPQATGLPTRLPGGVCIDTAVVYGGWLTCLEVDSGRFWQSNLAGKIRTGLLADSPTLA